jgi:hypothetical protein
MHRLSNFSFFLQGMRIVPVFGPKIPRLLIIWFLLGLSSPPLLAGSKIVVLGDPDLVVQVEAGLSQEGDYVVLDRDQLRASQGEQILTERAGVISTLTPDFYFLVMALEGQVHLRIVRAGSSELLAETLLPNCEALLPWVRTVAWPPLSPPSSLPDGFSIAVVEGGSDEARRAGISLRDALRMEGFSVLSRVSMEDLLREAEEGMAGWRAEDPEELAPLLGANILLVVNHDAQQVHALAANGSSLGRWSTDSAGQQELLAFLRNQRAEDPGWMVEQYRQRVSAEALAKYYRGVQLMETGFPLEAVELFQQATELNNQWTEAYLAEARCYDMADLPELARALRRWVARGLLGRATAAAANTQPRDGLTFLGVTSAHPDQTNLAKNLTFSAVDQLAGPGLLLPETLQDIAREMDLVTLGQRGKGVRWTTSPGFVSQRVLRGLVRGDNCRWILSNELAGTILAVHDQPLVEANLGDLRWLQDFVRRSDLVPIELEIRDFYLPETAELQAKIGRKNRPHEENLLILQSLHLRPGESLAIGGQLNKSSRERAGLDQFMAYGKREALLRLLPPEHPMRPWVELEQIQTFLPWQPIGPALSGETKDSSALLREFFESHAGHDAALLARYLWLYDEQANLPPAEVARFARSLETDLRRDNSLPRAKDLADFCATLVLLGEAADGRHQQLDFTNTTTPYHVRFEITPKGEIVIKNNDDWRVNEYQPFVLSGADLRNEARVALALQGRGHRGYQLRPSWLEEFPQSISLASYAAFGVMNSSRSETGLFLEEETGAAENISLPQKTLRYIVKAVEHWMPLVQNEEQYFRVDYTLAYLFPALFAGTHDIPAEESWALHEQMKSSMEETAKRIGVSNASRVKPRAFMLDWRKLTAEEIARQQKDSLRDWPQFYIDWERKGAALQEAARTSILGDPPTHLEWWRQLNISWNDTLSYRDFAAEHVVPWLPILHRQYGEGTLSDDERAFLLDVGTILLWGWRFAEAEEFFALVAYSEPSPGSDDAIRRALQGNALFQLARLQRHAGQKVEAMRSLTELLAVTEGLTPRLLERVKTNYRRTLAIPPRVRQNLRSLAMRLLEELRFEPERALLPEHCGVFRLPTRQLDNPEVTFFYRWPSLEEPRGVLLVLPGFNEGGAHWLEEENFLAKLAEEKGMAMLVPQFSQPHTLWMADHPCSPFHFPQLWSGALILQALEVLQSRINQTDAGELPLHVVGFGTGAQMGSRLTRWRPDLVASLSSNFALISPWVENESGLQPFAALRGKPVQIIMAEEQHFGTNASAPILTADLFHKALLAAGAEANLLPLNTSPTRIDDSAQEAITAFLRRQLSRP